jgi:thioredoxin-like negative regulator of GroEL
MRSLRVSWNFKQAGQLASSFTLHHQPRLTDPSRIIISMSTIAHVTSSTHFSTLLGSSTYLIVDFYADCCGPCKAIAPVFQQLATAEAKPGRLQFCKVDVDGQADVARKYSVSAYVEGNSWPHAVRFRADESRGF